MGGQTGQWLLLAVLSAALCTPIMADPEHFEPEPAEVSADHKKTAWPDVQEGEAGPSGRRTRRRRETQPNRQLVHQPNHQLVHQPNPQLKIPALLSNQLLQPARMGTPSLLPLLWTNRPKSTACAS